MKVQEVFSKDYLQNGIVVGHRHQPSNPVKQFIGLGIFMAVGKKSGIIPQIVTGRSCIGCRQCHVNTLFQVIRRRRVVGKRHIESQVIEYGAMFPDR